MMRLQVGILGATDEAGDRGRGLRPLRHPVVNALKVELEVIFLDLGIVPPENLQELAVARRTLVGRDDTIGRVIRATSATHSDLNHLLFSPSGEFIVA